MSYDPDCAGQCQQFGSHDDQGGRMQTRCLHVQFPAFFDRALMANTTRPQVGMGSMDDYGRQTDVNSSLRPCHSRIEGGCREMRIPDALNFDYLPFGWQQPDTRPWTFRVDTRQAIKDQCRAAPESWIGGTQHCQSRWKCQPVYPRDDDCAAVSQAGLDPYIQQYNDVYKLTLV